MLLTAALAVALAGCGGTAKTVPMADLSKAMTAAAGSLPAMSHATNADDKAADLFAYFSSLDYGKVEAWFIDYASDGSAHEIAVIAVKDAADAPAAQKSLQDHVAKRVSFYKSYAPDQTAIMEQATVVVSGRYVALLAGVDQAAVKDVFVREVG